jgi:hypothetical protein
LGRDLRKKKAKGKIKKKNEKGTKWLTNLMSDLLLSWHKDEHF